MTYAATPVESRLAGQYDATATAFSLSAPYYDADQARNRVARWSRRRSLRELDRAFKAGDMLLELGCGTGDEAIHLARRGASVLATDAAPAMVAMLSAKLRAEPGSVRERISSLVMPAGTIASLLDEHGPNSFDGAYSSFGPLNCEPDLGPIAASLSELVRPGGRVVLSLINRYCPWETLWYLAARRPRAAFRRWAGRANATVRGEWQETRVAVYYWSSREVERTFNRHFRPVRRIALPCFLPPQYLSALLDSRPALFKLLASMDRKLASKWPFNSLGDHTLFEFTRRPETC